MLQAIQTPSGQEFNSPELKMEIFRLVAIAFSRVLGYSHMGAKALLRQEQGLWKKFELPRLDGLVCTLYRISGSI